ncbi:MAG: SpoIIE family protein phosphatase [Planctomycetota bacterium]
MSVWTRRLSIRWIAPATIGGLVLVVAAVLGWLGVRRGEQEAAVLTDLTMDQVHERIGTRLDQLLELPARINRINVQLLREGKLDPDRLREWQRIMFSQIAAFPDLSSVCWGDETGRATWIARYPGRPKIDYAIKDEATGTDLHEYYYTADGGLETKPKDKYPYDPRKRPWYENPKRLKRATWSPPFGWIRADGKNPDLGISFAQPFHDESDEMIGVIDAELTLHDLSRYLHSLEIGLSGFAFIVDREGKLLATSRNIAVADAEGTQIAAESCGDQRIEAAARFLGGGWKSITLSKRGSFVANEARNLVEVTPYKTETGLDWVIVAVVPEDDFLGPVREQVWRMAGFGIAAVLATVALGLLLGMRFARPIRALRTHARLIGEGNFEHEVRLDQSSEFVQLSEALNEMQEGLRDRVRMRESLAMAMEVQQSLLPSTVPEHPGVDLAGHSTYCDETGGDYYDFLDISDTPDHCLTIAVGDVMGHGVAAAMLMATARGILHSRTRSKTGLADLMEHMNELLVRDTEGVRFMTMLLLTVDPAEGSMNWSSAGHGPPILYDSQTDSFPELARGQLPLGLVEGVAYEEKAHRDLVPGDIVLAATDALWETRNLDSEEVGIERLHDLLRGVADRPAQEISDTLRAAVEAWCAPRKPDDDLTLVVIKIGEPQRAEAQT